MPVAVPAACPLFLFAPGKVGTQVIWFGRLFENSGANNKSQFILAALFDKPMKVVKIDKAATDYYIKLTNLQSEYRRIGVNYNQAVKALHTGLSEKKALAMLYKLEQLTIELISQIGRAHV